MRDGAKAAVVCNMDGEADVVLRVKRRPGGSGRQKWRVEYDPTIIESIELVPVKQLTGRQD